MREFIGLMKKKPGEKGMPRHLFFVRAKALTADEALVKLEANWPKSDILALSPMPEFGLLPSVTAYAVHPVAPPEPSRIKKDYVMEIG